MKQARLRFYERYIDRADRVIENVLLPVLGIMALVAFLWNVGGLQT